MSRLICGVAINDIPGSSRTKLYTCWASMIHRCYNPKSLIKHPTYAGCSVDERWHRLSGFKPFFDANYKDGFELDKDIKVPGNKVYGPDTCCFIPTYVNVLLTNHASARGLYPQGVSYHKHARKFAAHVMQWRRKKFLGNFDTPEEAHEAYKLAKYKQMHLVGAIAFHRKHIDFDTYISLLFYPFV